MYSEFERLLASQSEENSQTSGAKMMRDQQKLGIIPEYYWARMFHFQVGGSKHAQALNSMEKFASTIKPNLVKQLGPLENIGASLPQAAE